jgi:hypothetical protein
MHPRSFLRSALFASALVSGALTVFAAEKSPAPAKSAAPYPLTTCVVSDEKLGSPADTVVYAHKEAGKPDREIRLCCDGCIDDFKKEPAKFLKKLDDAAKAAAKKKG